MFDFSRVLLTQIVTVLSVGYRLYSWGLTLVSSIITSTDIDRPSLFILHPQLSLQYIWGKRQYDRPLYHPISPFLLQVTITDH